MKMMNKIFILIFLIFFNINQVINTIDSKSMKVTRPPFFRRYRPKQSDQTKNVKSNYFPLKHYHGKRMIIGNNDLYDYYNAATIMNDQYRNGTLDR